MGRKLQSKITMVVELLMEQEEEERWKKGGSDEDIARSARTKSFSNSGATAQMTALPSNSTLRMTDWQAKVAVNYRQGTYAGLLPEGKCVCGEVLCVDHVLSCRHMRGRFLRHDALMAVVANELRQAGKPASTEVMINPDGQERMDIVHFDGPRANWTDVVVSNPLCSKSRRKRAASGKLAVARDAETGKKSPNIVVLAKDRRANVRPFAMETTGALGPSAQELVRYIAEARAEKDMGGQEDVDSGAIKRLISAHIKRITQRLAITMLKFNCVMLEEATIKARDPRNPALRLYENRLNYGRSFAWSAADTRRKAERARKAEAETEASQRSASV